MSFLRHVRACNQYTGQGFVPFLIDDQKHGLMRLEFANHLVEWPDIFTVSASKVELKIDLPDIHERSSIVATVVTELADRGVITHLHGEQYIATAGNREQGRLLLDRAAAPYFGIRAFGQHLNGFVWENGVQKLWLGRRSNDRIHYPGCLDNMVAGGLPAIIKLNKNLAKECWEEAGIKEDITSKALPVGAITYNLETEKGLKPDTLYCYDLELPSGFQPYSTDGEVSGFELIPVQDVMDIVSDSDDFKLNCNLVVIDFFIRHGYLGPNDDEYHDLITGLHPNLVV